MSAVRKIKKFASILVNNLSFNVVLSPLLGVGVRCSSAGTMVFVALVTGTVRLGANFEVHVEMVPLRRTNQAP